MIMEMETLLADLRALEIACGTGANKNERVIVLIHACIHAGCNTKGAIQQALGLLGWNVSHALIILSKSTGNNPTLYRWRRDEAGIYTNHI